MTKKERLDWLYQINRIHEEERHQRYLDSEEEIKRIIQSRDNEIDSP